MIRLLLALWIYSLAASAAPIDDFSAAIKKDRALEATRLLLSFPKVLQTEQAWMAQYYLMMRQPRQAFTQLQKLPEGTQKEVALGVWAALVTIPRPWNSRCEEPPQIKEPVLRFSLDLAEVWKDEVDHLSWSGVCDDPMPIVEEEEERLKLLEEARTRLKNAPAHYYENDFELFCLALDADVELPQRQTLANKFREKSNQPCLQKLKIKEPPAVHGTQKGSQVSLTTLTLKISPVNPSRLQLPIFAQWENHP